jgi:hypothetical protein
VLRIEDSPTCDARITRTRWSSRYEIRELSPLLEFRSIDSVELIKDCISEMVMNILQA